MDQFIADNEYMSYISGNFKLTKMTNNITLKMATTRHSVFMYCATPALEAKVSHKHEHSSKVTYFEGGIGDGIAYLQELQS